MRPFSFIVIILSPSPSYAIPISAFSFLTMLHSGLSDSSLGSALLPRECPSGCELMAMMLQFSSRNIWGASRLVAPLPGSMIIFQGFLSLTFFVIISMYCWVSFIVIVLPIFCHVAVLNCFLVISFSIWFCCFWL